MALLTIVGLLGVATVLIAYGMMTAGKWAANSAIYQWLNVIGTSGILLSLFASWNLPAFVANSLWILIGVVSLVRIYFGVTKRLFRSGVVVLTVLCLALLGIDTMVEMIERIPYAAYALVLYLIELSSLNIEVWIEVLGLIAPVLFLYAYAMVSLGRWPSTAIKFHLLNFLGGAFILLSLTQYWNLPVFILEICWCSISVVGIIKSIKTIR